MINKIKDNLMPKTRTDWVMFFGMLVSIITVLIYFVSPSIADVAMMVAVAIISGGTIYELITAITNKDNNSEVKDKK